MPQRYGTLYHSCKYFYVYFLGLVKIVFLGLIVSTHPARLRFLAALLSVCDLLNHIEQGVRSIKNQ